MNNVLSKAFKKYDFLKKIEKKKPIIHMDL